ncbi:hypothetical protein [Chryseobacterium rhizosphaerae]
MRISLPVIVFTPEYITDIIVLKMSFRQKFPKIDLHSVIAL